MGREQLSGRLGSRNRGLAAESSNREQRSRTIARDKKQRIQVSQQQFKEKTKLDLLKKGHYFEGKERIFHVVLHPNPFKLGA